jgi:hypothetical protein
VLSAACALALGLALGASPLQDPAASPAVDRPFHQLFRNLGNDFLALPSRDTAIIAVAGSSAAFAMRPADDDVSEWGQDRGHSQYARVGAWLGDGWVQGGAAVATYAVGVSTKNAKATHVGSDLIRAQFLNGLTTRALKIFVDRERPGGGGHSFPSGHSSAMFATAGVLGSHFGWKVAAPAYAIGGLVAWSRVRDGEHWLTDVVVGATLGAIIGRTVVRTHSASWTVVPTVSGSGKGILIVKN